MPVKKQSEPVEAKTDKNTATGHKVEPITSMHMEWCDQSGRVLKCPTKLSSEPPWRVLLIYVYIESQSSLRHVAARRCST